MAFHAEDISLKYVVCSPADLRDVADRGSILT